MAHLEASIKSHLELIEDQKSITISIENKRTNAVKYGSKRTREAYYRIFTELDNLWAKFIENDQLLTELASANDEILKQPYFVEKKKEVAEQLYEKALSYLMSYYPELNSNENDDREEEIPNPSVSGPSDNSSMSEFTLLKISEVLVTQQKFQQQIQQQIEMMVQKNQESKQGLKPPRVDIPVFDGNVNIYKSFKDTFLTVTDKSKISNLEKITLLKSKVSGIALEYIAHINISEQNYQKAWDALDERFDDPVVIISNNVDKILDMDAIPDNDVRAFEKALSIVQGVANSLDLLEIDANQVGLIRAIIRKLDHEASGELTRFVGNHKEFPDYAKIVKFFVHHLSILRARNSKENEISSSKEESQKYGKDLKKNKKYETKSHATVTTDPQNYRCFICFSSHLAPACDRLFAAENPIELLKHYNLCIKCASHKYNKRKPCLRKVSCEICKEEHLTVLHGKVTPSTSSFLCSNENRIDTKTVVLPTAVAKIFGNNAVLEKRMLIDICSQASYIEEQTLKSLNIPKRPCNISIIGVGGEVTGKVNAVATFKLETLYPTPQVIEVEAFVVKKVTRDLPSIPRKLKNLLNFNKPLADLYLEKPAHVPILLGANIASQIYLDGTEIYKGFVLQNTKFGWMVAGSAESCKQNFSDIVSTHVTLTEIEQSTQDVYDNFEKELKDFWDMPVTRVDIEEISTDICEDIYEKSHARTSDGRYQVPIPWKKDPGTSLGNSFDFALKCFLSLERRFERNKEHKDLSHKFMQEYIQLGHMSLIPVEERHVTDGTVYYIPYHSILRKDAVTTKLRNVFNASAKTANGVSLNEIIYPGPKLQTKIFDIITRPRQFKYIYFSDITKMYRQIELLPEDRERIRILYRENSTEPLKEFCLNTVTYGMDCAPWQAIRTIKQVSEDHATCKDINWIIQNAFYMDDLYHGADSVKECQQQIRDITEVLNKGKLPLTKWMANDEEILTSVEKDKRLESYVDLKLDNPAIKTLGIQYFPKDDEFGFKVKEFPTGKYTKRSMLSMSASLYDPIGWILPIIMLFRILIQKLWALDLKWDDKIPEKLKAKFESAIKSLYLIDKFKIPRWMSCSSSDKIDIIGFSDASGDGFAAVLYSRVKFEGEYKVTLLAARGRVTPLKTKRNIESKLTTIPKMELEGLCLLSNLMKDVKSCFLELEVNLVGYTDSQIVLAWLRKSEDVDNKFVKRRIHQIKKILSPGSVHYVKSSENPADAASRGLSATEFLKNQELWKNGPCWLKNEELPFTPFQNCTISCATQVDPSEDNFGIELLEKFSSFPKLISCVTIILMWINIFKKQKSGSATLFSEARKRIIILQQNYTFKSEIKLIKNGKMLPKGHWMSFLCPFIDDEGILRVGGRLDRGEISNDQKHPILIPKGHLARLIIKDIHLKNGHAANSLTDCILKQTYWITNSKAIIRSEIHRCSICLRFNAKTRQPQMSDLPLERIKPSPIFESTALDFCGPFYIRPSKLKFEKIVKAWVAVFVCMSTKLVHLELCLELSAENFLAAFERFTSRRSTPSQVLSDNGTNFVAAKKLLLEQLNKLTKNGTDTSSIQEIKWKLIPPGSPHFGGLHEACVKSFKYFLKRMGQLEAFTYEEFNTLICKIEALLNSRPLVPVSTDPNDEMVLTPGHFSVQRHLKAPPPTLVNRSPIPISKRWALVQQLQNEFWDRFVKEYLSTQQKRYKWMSPQKNIELDDVVIVKEHQTHPLNWPLGRVIKCYSDDKGVVRKIDLKSKNNSVIHRAVNKVIPLQNEDEQQNDARRPRTRKNFASPMSLLTLMTVAMICFSSNMTSIQAFSIEELQPGLNVRLLENDISVKVVDVKFTLKTNVNVTEDFQLMDAELNKFAEFCNSSAVKIFQNIYFQCEERYTFLLQELALSKSFIMGTYRSGKTKRGLLSKLTVGTILKKSHYAIPVAAAGWQEYEIWKLRKQVNTMDNKFKKVSFILLNLTEIENANIHQQLDTLVNQQQMLILEGEITSLAEEIQSLIESVKTRHEDFVNIRPIEEFKKYVEELNNPTPIARIPTQIENIFSIHPIRKYLIYNLVQIEYKIPVVRLDKWKKYVIISVPNKDDKLTLLDNSERVKIIVTSVDNSTYFFPEATEEIAPNIYDTVKLQIKPSCSSRIIKQENVEKFCTISNNGNTYKSYSIETGMTVLYNNQNSSVSCDKLEKVINYGVYLLIHQNCSLLLPNLDNSHPVEAGVYSLTPVSTIKSNFELLKFKENMISSTEVSNLKQKLIDALNEEIQGQGEENYALLGLIFFGIFMMFLLACLICMNRIPAAGLNIAREQWTSS